MALVSVTRLHLRSLRFLPISLSHLAKLILQAQRAEGLIGGTLTGASPKALWLMTTWKNEPAMDAWRTSALYKELTEKLTSLCDEVATHQWKQSGGEMPTWDDINYKLKQDRKTVNTPGPIARIFSIRL